MTTPAPRASASSTAQAPTRPTLDSPSSTPPRILVVMGVSGSGKSTLAALLAERLDWDLAEGDDLHPRANVEKMASGRPLDDDDRAPWLRIIGSWIDEHLDDGRPGVITCSALKRSYRDVLRRDGVVFVHVVGSRHLIDERMTARTDHFMPPALLTSQLATLEVPGPDERVVTVDASGTPDHEADEVVAALDLSREPRP